MNNLNHHKRAKPKLKNSLNFQKFKKKKSCEDPEFCIGHVEEYTCDSCRSNMGLEPNYPFNSKGTIQTNSYQFESVKEVLKTSSNNIF